VAELEEDPPHAVSSTAIDADAASTRMNFPTRFPRP
jgi:hypothetical protein